MTDRGNSSTRDTTPWGEPAFSPDSGCHHLRMVESRRQLNCLNWGIYIPRKRVEGEIHTLRETTSIEFFAEVPLGDVLDELITIMSINRPYSPKPNYIKYRRLLVDWMWEIGDTIRLAYTTIHHSVALMDTFFSKVKDIETTKAGKDFLQLVALTSIFISAKFREKDSRGPTAANISQLTRGQYSEKQILDWERYILLEIDWNLHFATPADFLVLLLNQGIVYSNDEISPNKKPSLKDVQFVRKFAEFFVDLWLQEYEFQKYDSHTLAWAIIWASRRSVLFKKTWNNEFRYLLNWTQKDVEKCYREIYKFYKASFKTKSDASQSSESQNTTFNNEQNVQKRPETTRQASSKGLRNRSNSIKGHLWKIESKNTMVSKPRMHIKKINTIQSSGNGSSIPRMATTNSGIVKTLRDTSFNWNITTPDKSMQNTSIWKHSSSNKKSSIKQYKPSEIQNRIPRPALYEINGRRPQIPSRNSKMDQNYKKLDAKRPTKLDFGSQGRCLKIASSQSRKTLYPWSTSYKKISTLQGSGNNKENVFNSKATFSAKKGLKLKIPKTKIYTTVDSKISMSRNQSFEKSKSRNVSNTKINDSVRNYRSMSSFRQASNRTISGFTSSATKYSQMGIGMQIANLAHNRSYAGQTQIR